MLKDGPPLQDLLDPDVELVEPDEAELRARQPEVLDLAAAKSPALPKPASKAAAGGGRGAAAAAAAAAADQDTQEEEDIVDLT